MKRRAGAMSKEYWPPCAEGHVSERIRTGACDDRAPGAVVGDFE